ncbi:hypothetical protein DSECCO2_388200 [anaerobic digester metagenome]
MFVLLSGQAGHGFRQKCRTVEDRDHCGDAWGSRGLAHGCRQGAQSHRGFEMGGIGRETIEGIEIDGLALVETVGQGFGGHSVGCDAVGENLLHPIERVAEAYGLGEHQSPGELFHMSCAEAERGFKPVGVLEVDVVQQRQDVRGAVQRARHLQGITEIMGCALPAEPQQPGICHPFQRRRWLGGVPGVTGNGVGPQQQGYGQRFGLGFQSRDAFGQREGAMKHRIVHKEEQPLRIGGQAQQLGAEVGFRRELHVRKPHSQHPVLALMTSVGGFVQYPDARRCRIGALSEEGLQGCLQLQRSVFAENDRLDIHAFTPSTKYPTVKASFMYRTSMACRYLGRCSAKSSRMLSARSPWKSLCWSKVQATRAHS